MEPKKTKPMGFWMVLIAVIAAAAILGMILVHGNRHTGGAVQVTQNGETVGLYPLDEDHTTNLLVCLHNTIQAFFLVLQHHAS